MWRTDRRPEFEKNIEDVGSPNQKCPHTSLDGYGYALNEIMFYYVVTILLFCPTMMPHICVLCVLARIISHVLSRLIIFVATQKVFKSISNQNYQQYLTCNVPSKAS